ncbi:MAG: hypothetical protein K2N42_01730 [Anaeroplasmataceae bacterium]|nr:hypothetical protein [Anaeroplasmataceae bacterium]
MILANATNYTPLIIGICCAAAVLIIAIILLVVFLLKRKKHPRIKINTEFINNLVEALGGRGNILDAKTINGRLHFEVEDLEIVALDALKALSTAGVFITNQTIKMLFNYDSASICKTVLALPKSE